MGERRRFHWLVIWIGPLAALALIISIIALERVMALSPVRPRLHDSYDAVSENDLRLLEKEIGAPLPKEYRQFILSCNGGDYPCEVEFNSTNGEFVSSLVGFYGVGASANDELGDAYRTLTGYLPDGLVPIGNDSGNGQTCIKVSGNDIGSIWIWQLNAPDDQGSFVANNFDAFLAGLCYGEMADLFWNESLPDFVAAERGDVDALAERLKEGLDPNSRNGEGWTLLICASAAGQPDIVKLLLEYCADLELRDGKLRTALYWAARHSSLDSAKLLVTAGADLEAADDEGETPLLIGVSSGTRVPRFLMEQGANVNAKNRRGEDIFELSQDYADELHALILRRGGRRERK
jgi:hypothetical protein